MNWFLYIMMPFILGAAGAWCVIRLGGSYGLMDLPGSRSSHHRPTPKGGGIGILLSFIAVSLFNTIPLTLWLPATIISVISFVDDRIELSKSRRLLVHFICALIVIVGSDFSWMPSALHSFFWVIIGSLFLVGSANFFNFMDGINGIAGILAAVGFGLLAIYGILQGVAAEVILLDLCIVFACIGFLPFNFPNARVFMGDTGSVLIGFLFAALVLVTSANLLDIISCAAFFFLIYADAATTFLIRFIEGDPILVPHRRHLYQILVNELSLPHWIVSIAYGIIQLLIGFIVIVLHNFGLAAVIRAISILGLLFIAVSFFLHHKADQVPTTESHL